MAVTSHVCKGRELLLKINEGVDTWQYDGKLWEG